MLDVFTSRHGIPLLKVGGPILSILEAAAQSDVRSSEDVFEAIDARNLDDAEGVALDRWGESEGVPRLRQSPAAGTVDVGDSSFEKVSSRVYHGTAAPIAGSTSVNVDDAEDFPTSGQVYIGRGTLDYEGPIAYSAKADNGTFWTLTLSSPTLKFHNLGESVVLAQGGERPIEAGQIVQTPRSGLSDPVSYRVLFREAIPDGEVSISGVQVVCQKPGAVGNAPAGAITEFAAAPFDGATVSNPSPFSNGLDTEEDDDYRERIRAARAERIKGTPLAIQSIVLNVVSPDEGRRVTSASFVRGVGVNPSLLVVDDGTGYEERAAGIALEQVIDNASGGEEKVAVKSFPVAKALLVSQSEAPYTIRDASVLSVEVGGTVYRHTFADSDFLSPDAATAYEVVASINANQLLGFGARTLDGGQRVVVFGRGETGEDVEVVATEDAADANEVLAFPAGAVPTMRLYRNDRLLSKDGRLARLASHPHSGWNTMAGSQTLDIAVDGTPAMSITFTDSDFVNAGTGFVALGRNTPAAWVAVINIKVPGVTASTDGTRIYITSNRSLSDGASVEVTGGTLVDNRAFPVDLVEGVANDYVLDRSVGQINLSSPLTSGDRLSVGTRSDRAFLESGEIAPVTLADDGALWAVPDGSSSLVETGLGASASLTLNPALVVHDWGYRANIDVGGGIFGNIRPGDWLVLWDDAWPTTFRGAYRTEASTPDWVQVARRSTSGVRAGHAMSVLVPTGVATSKVLVTGGWIAPTSDISVPIGPTSSCTLYDHATKLWTAAAPMSVARAYHTATTLDDGRVLVVGGVDADGNSLASAEIYTPGTDTWAAATAYQVAVAYHSATKLADGRVLVAGGLDGSTYRTESAVFNPVGDTWSANVAMSVARAKHGACLLPSGKVFAAGGETTGGSSTATTETFDPAGPSWAVTDPMPSARKAFGLSTVGVAPTTVVAVGDDRAGANTGTYSVYTIAGDSWGADIALPGTAPAFENKTVVKTQNGNVLALHGREDATVGQSLSWDGATWTVIANASVSNAFSVDEVAMGVLYDLPATVLNQVITMGGINPLRRWPTASALHYDGDGDFWYPTDPVPSGSLTLPDTGFDVGRTTRYLQKLVIPAAVSYTATSFASVLDEAAVGMTASTYRTHRLRLATNSHDEDRDVAVFAADLPAQEAGLEREVRANTTGHVGSVETASEGVGTPDFKLRRILEEVPSVDAAAVEAVRVNMTDPDGSVVVDPDLDVGYDRLLVVARNHWDGRPTDSSTIFHRYGRSAGFFSTLADVVYEGDVALLSVREAPHGGLLPYDRVYMAAPYAVGPEDDLIVVADEDVETKRFAANMFRRLTAVGAIYSSQMAFTDADNGNASLAAAFGLGFDFNDFVLYMKARGKAFTSDSSRSMMFRYYLHGASGERARVRVNYPDAPDSEVECVVENQTGTDYSNVHIQMKGGPRRTTSSVRSSARVGVAATASTNDVVDILLVLGMPVANASRDGADETTLTLTLPPSVTDCGFTIGDTLFLESASPNWTSGTFNVSFVGAPGGPTQDIKFTNIALGTGVVAADPNIGTVSFDPQGEATLQGSSIAVGDFVRVEFESSLPEPYKSYTHRVYGFGDQYIEAKSGPTAIQTNITWHTLNSADYFKLFENPADDANTFVADVNALAAAEDSTCPVTAVALGSGLGTIDTSLVEFETDDSAWAYLVDGVNWVSRTVNPVLITDDYEFVLKRPIDATLATDSDLANEDFRVCPITVANVVDWLNSPAVSGLFTACEVVESDGGRRVQVSTQTLGSIGSVQVQGGLANSASAIVHGTAEEALTIDECFATVRRADVSGLLASPWVEAANSLPAHKLGIFTSSTVLNSWDADGYMELSTPVYTEMFNQDNVRLHWERQGRYMVVSDPAGLNGDGAMQVMTFSEGDYVRFTVPTAPTPFDDLSEHVAASANQGIYRVVRVIRYGEGAGVGGAVWIENELGVEETAECRIYGYSYDSVMPGDVVSVSTDLWGGSANRGDWVVEAVGVDAGVPDPQFVSSTKLKVSVASRRPTPVGSPTAALGADSQKVLVVEGAPSTLLKRVVAAIPDQNDGAFATVRMSSGRLSRLISESLGTVLSPVDKLGFPTDVVPGVDGYKASVGLVGESNRVAYGDPADPATYPGVVAAGAKVIVQGPVVKRVQVSLQIRTLSGFALPDVATRVRSAVASVVNQTGVGRSIALSDVVRSAAAVQGVSAVAVLSPQYNSGNDSIPVSANEKLLVLDLDRDVLVSFTTE
jgi:uncharacterized phage protein gp47/JayE